MKKNIITILATLLLLIGNVLPVFAAETVTINFTTDKDAYTAQGKIYVTGKVLKGTAAGKGTSPTLMFKNSSGKLVEAYQWTDSAIAADGSIYKTITLGKNLTDGTYTITISALNAQQVTKQIQITGYTQYDLSVNTSKVDYKTGETVNISGTVASGGQPTVGANVILTLEKSGIKVSDIATVTTITNGSFSYNNYQIPTNTVAGAYSIKATLADGSKSATKDINITVASNPDPQPNPPGPGTDPIPVPGPELKAPDLNIVTSESTIITGMAEKGSKVTITDKKLLVLTAMTDADGKFTVTLPSKIKAGTILYVIATNDSGLVSKETTIVVIDKTAPSAPIVNVINDFNRSIKGNAEANAKITIKADNTLVAEGKANDSGIFNIPIKAQKAGTTLSITATDLDGNVSIITEITVMDKTAPAKAIITSVTTTKITGKAEANATVNVKLGSKLLAKGNVDGNGNFTIKLSAQKAGTVLYVSVIDEASNISALTKVTVKATQVKDTTPPPVPTVTSVTQTKIVGKAEPNAYVFVKVGTTVIAKGTANSNGSFSITLKKQKVGTTLYIYAKDKSLNISKAKKVTVK